MADLILVFNNRGIIASTLMTHDVFISYARGDHSRAAQLASVLATKGWSVWWDRDILPGRTFDDVIEEALTNARSVVVLWSAESVKSRWVRTEASAAAERDALVPVLIENVTIPLEFRQLKQRREIRRLKRRREMRRLKHRREMRRLKQRRERWWKWLRQIFSSAWLREFVEGMAARSFRPPGTTRHGRK